MNARSVLRLYHVLLVPTELLVTLILHGGKSPSATAALPPNKTMTAAIRPNAFLFFAVITSPFCMLRSGCPSHSCSIASYHIGVSISQEARRYVWKRRNCRVGGMKVPKREPSNGSASLAPACQKRRTRRQADTRQHVSILRLAPDG